MTTRTATTVATMTAAALAMGGCTSSGSGVEEVFLATYEPCVATDECLPSDLCIEISTDTGGRIVTDAICTHDCFDDLDCPLTGGGVEGACLDLGSGFLCYERCFDDFDCPSGFGCVDVFDGLQDAVCLPV